MVLDDASGWIIFITEGPALAIVYFIILNLHESIARYDVSNFKPAKSQLWPVVTQLAEEFLCGLLQILDNIGRDLFIAKCSEILLGGGMTHLKLAHLRSDGGTGFHEFIFSKIII